MGRDTSAMVIPSFYTRDDVAPPQCTGAAGEHLVGDGLASSPRVSAISKDLAKPGQQPASGWRESEIISDLFLGDLQDAATFDGMIISVLPDAMAAEPKRAIRLPFLANGRASLDTTSALIDAGLRLGMPVLVHCEEGCERAPLVVAWFLKTRRGMSLDEAYALIKRRRPIVKDRRAWLGIYNSLSHASVVSLKFDE
jgi:hypothetical protein